MEAQRKYQEQAQANPFWPRRRKKQIIHAPPPMFILPFLSQTLAVKDT